MRGVPRMDIWAHKDAFEDLQKHLNAADVAQLRAVCRDWRGVVDSTLSRLVPVNLDCPLLASRALPGLKSLLLTQLQYLEPQQLHHCSVLSHLTQLHIGGPACSRLKTHHLAWVGKLTNLQELSISKCSKVKLSILSCWHSLTNLQAVSLIGLSANLRTTSSSPSNSGNSNSSNSSTSSSSNNNNSSSSSSVLHAFLSAGVASSLTSLVLGDHQGLSFLSDSALEGLGQLLGPVGRLRVLDLSGCIELTDAGIQQLSGLTSLEQLSLHNSMKISTGATQTLTAITALRTLNLRGCSQLRDAQLLPVLNTLTRLESLNLQGCSGLMGTCISPHICKGLVHLRILNLSYCQGLGNGVFHGLVEFCELRDLDMTGCNIVSGWEALQWLGKLKQLVRLQGSYWRCKAVGHPAAAGTAAEAAALLLPPNLKHLDLSHLTCSDSFLQTLTSHFPKPLTYLNLSNCSGIGPASSTDCLDSLSRLGNLETLMLSSSVGGIPAQALQCLNGLTGLRDLQLEFVHDTAAMTSDMLAAIGDSNGSSTTAWLDHLMACSSSSSSVSAVRGSSTFDGTGNASRPAAAAAAAAAGYVAANRAGLYKQPVAAGPATGVAQLLAGTTGTSITDCFSKDGSSSSGSSSSGSSSSSRTMLNQTAQRELFPAAPKLAQDSEPVVKEQQQSWLLDLQRLRNLSVTFSPWVTDQILEDLSGLTGLTSLNLVACQNLTGSGFQSWIPHHRHSSSSSSSSGSSCCDEAAAVCCSSGCAFCSTGGPNLMSLKLTGCASLTDDGLAAAAAACPLLEELLLPGCRGLTDQGVKQLSNLSRLQTLSLASNKNITAGSLHALVPNLQHLRTLALSLCGGICDAALDSLALATDLRSLDLRGCWQITDDGVFDLLCRSFSLMQLNVDSCHRLGNRCWPETFRPGDPLLPFTDISSSSRPGLLIRVAAAASGATNTLKGSKRTDCNLPSGDEDDESISDGTATSGSKCTTA